MFIVTLPILMEYKTWPSQCMRNKILDPPYYISALKANKFWPIYRKVFPKEQKVRREKESTRKNAIVNVYLPIWSGSFTAWTGASQKVCASVYLLHLRDCPGHVVGLWRSQACVLIGCNCHSDCDSPVSSLRVLLQVCIQNVYRSAWGLLWNK